MIIEGTCLKGVSGLTAMTKFAKKLLAKVEGLSGTYSTGIEAIELEEQIGVRGAGVSPVLQRMRCIQVSYRYTFAFEKGD